METTESPTYTSYNQVLSNYVEGYEKGGIEDRLTRNGHMSPYDGEPCASAAKTVITDLLNSAQFPPIESKINRVEILDRLTETARLTRKIKYDLKPTTVDAVLISFINYVGGMNGVDCGLYARDLDNENKS